MSNAQFQENRSLMIYQSKNPTQIKKFLQKIVTGWFCHKTREYIVFMTMLWLFSANWCLKKNWVSNCGMIQPDVFSTFWVHSEFICTHWHIGTSFTGFNGGLVGFGVLSKVLFCLSGLVLFFASPFIIMKRQSMNKFFETLDRGPRSIVPREISCEGQVCKK